MKNKKLLTILIVCIFFLMGIASGSTKVDEDTTIKKNDNKETIKEELPTIEEQVLFETNGIKVTAKEITNGFLGPELKILVENASDKDITLELDDIAVNDYMVTAFLYEEVAAGKKSNTSFSIYSSTLKDAGITNIGKLDLYFYIIEQSTYNRIYESDGIELKTSLCDKMDDKLDISGEEMVNQDGIRIVGKGLSKDSIFGSGVVLYIENNSNRNITVSSDNLSVNGYMITSFLHRPLRPNKKAVDTIILSSSDMEENGIEQIDELSLVLEVYDSDTYSTIFKTNELNFNIER